MLQVADMGPKDKMISAREHKCWSPWRLYIERWRTVYLWALSMEFAACHPTGAQNFEMVPRFGGKFVRLWISER